MQHELQVCQGGTFHDATCWLHAMGCDGPNPNVMEATYEWFDLSDRLDRRDHGGPFAAGPALIGVKGSDVVTFPDTHTPPVAERTPVAVQWGAVIAGAIGAAALAFVLHGFAIAIGLSVSSTAPTWRDTSVALVLLSGLYLVLAALISYGFGGYLAGRLRGEPMSGTAEETEFRDGTHGLLVWAIATVLTGVFALAALPSVTKLAAPSTDARGPSVSAAGESMIAYELDRLFRGERRAEGDPNLPRAEAARILLTASSHSGMQPDDRAYLVRLVSARTGLAAAEADGRVNDVVARAKEDISRARRSALIIGFMTAAAALLGAAAAWYAACAGGEQRDGRAAPHPLLDWRASPRRV